jgi:hypothetical protein
LTFCSFESIFGGESNLELSKFWYLKLSWLFQFSLLFNVEISLQITFSKTSSMNSTTCSVLTDSDAFSQDGSYCDHSKFFDVTF